MSFRSVVGKGYAPCYCFCAYDEAGRTLGEYDGNGEALEEYVYLDGFRPVALVRNIGLTMVADIYPILTDHLGTPRKVLDATGAPQWTWDAKDPYGHQMPDQLVGGSTFMFNLRFPGQRYDSETGLYHNGFRDYNPATGRYVQADPIGLAGGWNPYAYVMANPVNATDPFGLESPQYSLGQIPGSVNRNPCQQATLEKTMGDVAINIAGPVALAEAGMNLIFNSTLNPLGWGDRENRRPVAAAGSLASGLTSLAAGGEMSGVDASRAAYQQQLLSRSGSGLGSRHARSLQNQVNRASSASRSAGGFRAAGVGFGLVTALAEGYSDLEACKCQK